MVSKTGIGIGNGIPFGNNSSGGDRPYLSPELKSRLRIVAYTYGKRNGDADRATIRNLVDPDNPLICHNFAWIPNSGYGFTTNYRTNSSRADIEILGEQHWLVKSVTQEGTNRQCINIIASSANFAGYTFNIKCSGIKDTDDITARYGYAKYIQLKNGDNIVTYEAMPNDTDYYVFDFNKEVENIEIEVEPIMQDSLVTDGVNDIIVATKTAGEMFADMGNETAISFVSKFHLIAYESLSFNNLRNVTDVAGRNLANKDRDITRKDVIIGWTKKNINDTISPTLVSGILGDDADYLAFGGRSLISDQKFCPVGYIGSSSNVAEVCKIAYEWTIGGIGTFTEDDINQIIAYYRLDRTIKADIYCNIKKQGITNENHNDFSNQLIDYSGNGRNIQMNNLGWVGGSGIAAKQGESIRDWSKIPDEGRQELTIYNEFKYKVKSNEKLQYWILQYINSSNTSYPITIVTDKDCFWSNSVNLYDEEGNKQVQKKEIAIPANTPTQVLCCGFDEFPDVPEGFHPTTAVSYAFLKEVGELTIEFIPSHKGAIILDGVNDFGKAIGLPISKDYTIAIDYQRLSIGYIENIGTTSPISKYVKAGQGAFLMNLISSTGQHMNTYSFGETSVSLFNDLDRQIYYQSKYKNQGFDIIAGTGEDSNSLWLGAVRDSDARFFNGAIYSLIMFPYSMNKFLLDRQLKKYKSGTLYKDMVQFRPVIKSNESYNDVVFYKINGSEWTRIYSGDFIPVGQMISITINLNLPYKITKAISSQLDNISIRKSSGTSNSFDIVGYVKDKTPQKLNLTVEVDETLVKFNPTINSNVPYTIRNSYVIRDPVSWTQIKVGNYLSVGERIAIQLYFNEDKGDVYEITNCTCPQLDNINYTRTTSNTGWTIFGYLKKGQNTQNITIEVDEYIKYEDIVQPYPAFISLTNYNTKQVYTFGDKIKVNTYVTVSEITNLLTGLYSDVSCFLNGQRFFKNFNYYISKDDVFTSTKTYTKDDNEPTAWLSPRLLRMPNSSYKYLGYIPDITGHGNHGYIKNSAYGGGSGANNYRVDFNKLVWSTGSSLTRISNDYQIKLVNSTTSIGRIGANVQSCTSNLYSYKIKVSGLQTDDTIDYYYSKAAEDTERTIFKITTDGEYILPNSIANSNDLGSIHLAIAIAAGNTVEIEEIGLNEGCFFLDGVDDSIEFSNSFINNSKQVILNTLWQTALGLGILYDARNNENSFAIYNTGLAYLERNQKGNTYIDGIENKYINSSNLQDKTHVIVSTNNDSISNYPFIGCTRSRKFYTKMAIWDCVLFPEISTPAMITSHSKYVGIKPKIEIPMWYYDAHGKTNFDTYKTQITEQIGYQKNGTSGNYVANNYNFAYEGMSGYNGYSVVFGENKTWNNMTISGNSSYVSNKIDITRITFKAALLYSWIKQGGEFITANNKDIESFKIKVTGIETDKFYLRYSYLQTSDAITKTNYSIDSDGIYELPKSFENDESLSNSDEWIGFSFIKKSIDIPDIIENVNVVIEVLPKYPNSLVYDGITDYTEQIRIPTMTDFTLLIKALRLTDFIGSGGAVIKKGDSKSVMGGGFDFVYCLDSSTSEANRNSYWSFGGKCLNPIPMPLIGYMTKTDVNGVAIAAGTNPSKEGITIGYWSGHTAMAFYKTIIYDKTIEQFWIDFLRNMMAREEIIDITYPIFIQGTGGGMIEPEVYSTDFTKWTSYPKSFEMEVTDHTIHITKCINSTRFLRHPSSETHVSSMKIKVTGLTANKITYRYSLSNGTSANFEITADGEYTLPESAYSNNLGWTEFYLSQVGTCDITITLYPI